MMKSNSNSNSNSSGSGSSNNEYTHLKAVEAGAVAPSYSSYGNSSVSNTSSSQGTAVAVQQRTYVGWWSQTLSPVTSSLASAISVVGGTDYSPVVHSTNEHEVFYPLSGGYFKELSVEVLTFPEFSDHVDNEEIVSTLRAVNAVARAHGPHYHIPIYIGSTILLVAGGFVLGVVALGAGLYYMHRAQTQTRIAIEALLRQENQKEAFTAAGVRWVLTSRGILMEYTGWELVESSSGPSGEEALSAASRAPSSGSSARSSPSAPQGGLPSATSPTRPSLYPSLTSLNNGGEGGGDDGAVVEPTRARSGGGGGGGDMYAPPAVPPPGFGGSAPPSL